MRVDALLKEKPACLKKSDRPKKLHSGPVFWAHIDNSVQFGAKYTVLDSEINLSLPTALHNRHQGRFVSQNFIVLFMLHPF